jgi:hypothetical protein
MTTWSEYLQNSLGLKIVLGVCLALSGNIIISRCIEKRRLHDGLAQDDKKIKSIIIMKRLWTGMLVGFLISVTVGTAQFIIRFGYFTLLQEIGVVFLGFIGTVIGAVCGLFQWPRKST